MCPTRAFPSKDALAVVVRAVRSALGSFIAYFSSRKPLCATAIPPCPRPATALCVPARRPLPRVPVMLPRSPLPAPHQLLRAASALSQPHERRHHRRRASRQQAAGQVRSSRTERPLRRSGGRLRHGAFTQTMMVGVGICPTIFTRFIARGLLRRAHPGGEPQRWTGRGVEACANTT